MDNPNEPNETYGPFMQPHKKSGNGAVIVAIAVGVLVLCICAVSAVAVVYIVKSANDKAQTAAIQEETEQKVPEEAAETDKQTDAVPRTEEKKRTKEGNTDAYKNASEDDYFLQPGYTSSWGSNHVNHAKAEFTGAYYDTICECIDYSVPYEITRKYYEYQSPNQNVTIRMAYIQLEGDIPHLKELNETILSYSAYFAESYFDQYSEEDSYEGYVNMSTDSFVVYNDEHKMSILLDEQWEVDQDSSFDLYAINIDMDTGAVLDNSSILKIDDAFSADFRERSGKQNGESEADLMTDEQISAHLSDDQSNILFYTPVGMEVGYNFYGEETSGWITASYPDYEAYMNLY